MFIYSLNPFVTSITCSQIHTCIICWNENISNDDLRKRWSVIIITYKNTHAHWDLLNSKFEWSYASFLLVCSSCRFFRRLAFCCSFLAQFQSPSTASNDQFNLKKQTNKQPDNHHWWWSTSIIKIIIIIIYIHLFKDCCCLPAIHPNH